MTGKKKTSSLGFFLRNNIYVISIPLAVIVFTAINPNFISWYNISNLMYAIAPVLMLSGGLTFVLLLGGIDLSTGALCTCTCVLTGLNIVKYGNKYILLMVLLGIFAGLLNGVLVAILKMPSFIATLCTQSIWKCVALVACGGTSYSIGLKERAVIEWTNIKILGLPILFWIMVVLYAGLIFLEKKTPIGHAIFPVGANAQAARMSGINVNAVKITAFLASGICSAITGIMYGLIMKGAIPTIGNGITLQGIASVAVGGTSLAGGSGSVIRTIFGCVTIMTIQTGLNVIGLDAYWQDIVFGIILIGALVLNSDRSLANRVVK